MKHWLFCCFMAAVIFLTPVAANAEIVTPELLRLHVVAESDSDEDQALKLLVRDGMLEVARRMFTDVGSAEEAYRIAQENIGEFEERALQIVSDAGVDCRINAETGEFDFPVRIYGDALVPAGRYRAVKITIGTGEGHNWWCVLYPTLCSIDESAVGQDSVLTFCSQTLEFLKGLFGGDAV